jgi:hypothetical protein
MEQEQITPEVLATRVLSNSERQAEIRAALRSMRNQGILVAGLFRRRNGTIVVNVGKFILTGDEIIELMKQGQLNVAGIEDFAGPLHETS